MKTKNTQQFKHTVSGNVVLILILSLYPAILSMSCAIAVVPIKPTKIQTADLGATSLTIEDTVDGASSTITEPPVPIVTTILPVSWLAVHLLESGIDEKLVLDCESKLIVNEGIVSEANFADLPPSDVDVVYLKEIGISAKGAQMQIIKLHRMLYAQHNIPSPPPPPLPNPTTTVLPTKGAEPHENAAGNHIT